MDEFRQQHVNCTDLAAYTQAHQTFASARAQRLTDARVQRRAKWVPLALEKTRFSDHPACFAIEVLKWAHKLHAAHHSTDPQSGKRVSFGLVRMANIEPLVDVALALFKAQVPEGLRIHLCVYHSQFPLLIRSCIEQRLDQALNRREPHAVFKLPDIRQRLDAHPDEADHLFIVLGSPVTEVGRDHDYDWAVVEPSSMRSLIQLAGRVRRHRSGECTEANLRVFNTNLRHAKHGSGQPAFCKPGFESADFLLNSHQLTELLHPNEREVVDARPRIQARPDLKPATSWVDLEHARMQATLLPAHKLNAASWWHLPPSAALLTAALPQLQPFRHDPVPRVDLVLLPNDECDDYSLTLLMQPKSGLHGGQTLEVPVDRSQNHRISAEQVQGQRMALWGQADYMVALAELASQMAMDLHDCARRFGTVTLPRSEGGWRFHPALGFTTWRG